jgi:hypothetical protein
VVIAIAFDIDLPGFIFNSSQTTWSRFASDFRGDPLPQQEYLVLPNDLSPVPYQDQPHRTPPPDFDPSRSRLSFHWLRSKGFAGVTSSLTEVFAGGYFLGNLHYDDPSSLSCKRSPDGRLIAFLEGWHYAGVSKNPLRWLALSDIDQVFTPLPTVNAQNFAFSPDSWELAFIGCIEGGTNCALYLVDLQSRQTERDLDLQMGYSLAWSPNGSQLAFLGALSPNGIYSVIVIDPVNGEITYTGEFDWQMFSPASDSPTHTWDIQFPDWFQNPEDCSAPPPG